MKKVLPHRVFALTVLVSSALVFVGCNTSAPVSSLGSREPGGPATRPLQFIPFAKKPGQLHKIYIVTDYVTYAEGGKLKLDYDGDYEFEAELEVPIQSISEDAELSIQIDDESFVLNFDVTFQPHGITFSKPALLTLKADGLDLTNVDPASVKLYYDNPETGVWEEMEVESVTVDEVKGKVTVKNAKLPHFSRYALAHS